MKILYVCNTNKGRSAALKAYTEDYIKKEKLENILVESAGIDLELIDSLRKREINHASRNTEKILKEEGIDISNHRLNYIGDKIKDSDLILISDELTLARTRAEFPHYKNISHLARKYAGFNRHVEIFGPYAQSRTRKKQWTELVGYRDMLREIKIVSRRIVKKIASQKN